MKCKLILWLILLMLTTVLVVSCSSETEDRVNQNDTVNKIETSGTTPTVSAETSLSPATTSQPTTSSPCSATTSTAPITTTEPTVHKITPEEAKSMIDQGGITLVDVRRADEFEQGHIPGALLVPNETILEEAATKLPNKNAVILIYCRSGRRSAEAANKLVSLGYTQVYDFGGILDWPYETTQ